MPPTTFLFSFPVHALMILNHHHILRREQRKSSPIWSRYGYALPIHDAFPTELCNVVTLTFDLYFCLVAYHGAVIESGQWRTYCTCKEFEGLWSWERLTGVSLCIYIVSTTVIAAITDEHTNHTARQWTLLYTRHFLNGIYWVALNDRLAILVYNRRRLSF